jgi:ketosteroid isomerase-like protein
MKTLHRVALVCLLAVPIQVAQPESARHPEYEIVRAVIEDSIGWALTKDTERLFQIFADDEDLLVWWVGTTGSANGIGEMKKLAETVWMTPHFKATTFEVRDMRIWFSVDGSVSWFSCMLDDCGTWKGEEFCANDVRVTGVLEKRGEQWTIVQYHGSWPVDQIPEETWQRLERARQRQHSED